MPKSKRVRSANIAGKVQKKTAKDKLSNIEKVRNEVLARNFVYVVEVENERNVLIQQLREVLKASTCGTSTLFLTRNRLLQVALGVDAESSLIDNVFRISGLFSNHKGLIASDIENVDELRELLNSAAAPEYARPGTVANRTVLLEAGELCQFSGSLEVELKRLKVPVKLENGKLMLMGNFFVCKEGESLSYEAAHILKLLKIQTALFKVTLVARWSKKTGGIEFF